MKSRDIALVGILLAAGAIARYISLFVPGAIVANLTIAFYCLAIILVNPTFREALGIGLVAGIILTPIGMIAGSFLGAFLAELIWAKKDLLGSLKAAVGSFIGFMLGTGLKTIVACLIMWQIIVYAF